MELRAITIRPSNILEKLEDTIDSLLNSCGGGGGGGSGVRMRDERRAQEAGSRW